MKRNKLLSIFVLLLSVLLLSGCGSKTDDKNDYKLPLGDAGYECELDFYLNNKNALALSLSRNEYSEETIPNEIKLYESTTNTYNFTLAAKISDRNSSDTTVSKVPEYKYIAVQAGYYTDETNNQFVPILNSENTYIEYYKLTKELQLIEYSFNYSNEYNENDFVVKVITGTRVDEECLKDELNESDLKNHIKAVKGVSIRFNEAKINSTNLLVLTNKDETPLERANNSLSLYYYNTATIKSFDSGNVLILTLNSKTGVWQWFIEILGIALFYLIGVLGNKYWLGVLIFTLVIRTAAWPIYAKSNSYSQNMSKIQPEMQKIQAKYEGRTDQNSQMKQQMEMRELMKKNKVSVFGCLTPFLQMPIFIAVYQVFSRFPLTPAYQSVDYNFAGISFGMTYGKAESSWVLAILVGVTMLGSQLLSMYMTKISQKKHENFYTKQQNNKQQNKSMLIFMIVMTAMMVYFAFTNAGIAFYWVIGNLYQIGQTALSKYISEQKEEKERLANGKVRGR